MPVGQRLGRAAIYRWITGDASTRIGRAIGWGRAGQHIPPRGVRVGVLPFATPDPGPRPKGRPAMPQPIPDSPEVIKILIAEADQFLDYYVPLLRDLHHIWDELPDYIGPDKESQTEFEAFLATKPDVEIRFRRVLRRIAQGNPHQHTLWEYLQPSPVLDSLLQRSGESPDASSEELLALKHKYAGLDLVIGQVETVRNFRRLLIGKLEGPAPLPRPKLTEYRDNFIFKRYRENMPLKQIAAEVKQNSEWDEIATEEGIRRAAKRYARRHGIEVPEPRKRGRRVRSPRLR